MGADTFGSGEGAALGAFLIAFYGLFCLGIILALIAQWKIFAKTGNSGALSLLMLIPIAGIAVILWLAFSEWPIEREVAKLKSRLKQSGASSDDWD